MLSVPVLFGRGQMNNDMHIIASIRATVHRGLSGYRQLGGQLTPNLHREG